MAITLVTNDIMRQGVPVTIDSTGSDFIIIACMVDAGSSTFIVESVGATPNPNTWIPLTQQLAGDSSGGPKLWYTIPVLTGASHSVTAGGTHMIQGVAAFSGLKQTSTFDQQNGSTSLTPGSLTPSEDNCLVITAYSQAGGSGGQQNAISDGFSIIANGDASPTWGGGFAYKVQTSAAAANPTWSGNSTLRESSLIASFFSGASSNTGAFGTYAYLI